MDPRLSSPGYYHEFTAKHELSSYSYLDSRISGTTIGGRSTRFKESVYLIPSPGSEGKPITRFEPLIMRLIVVVGMPLFMLALGIGLEVEIFLSLSNGGFEVPESHFLNIFGYVSAQFLASFVPTLIIMPVALAWRELDWMLRWYQPYITLNKGNATAENSLLLDYIALGPFLAIPRAVKYKHRIIFWSCMTAALTYLFQPLAGSIFQIRQLPQAATTFVTGLKQIGLSPNIGDLNGFSAAAGYVDASVLHGLGDPPFVDGGWATARFTFPPRPYLDGILTLLTVGLQSVANCSNPIQGPTIASTGGTASTITATSVEGCAHTVSFDSSSSTQQYGVDSVPCEATGAASLHPQFQPVMFWFMHTKYDSTQQAKAIFCTPRISASKVKVVADLNDGSIISVKGTAVKGAAKPPTSGNDVFGGAQAGKAYNGVIFNSSVTDPFIQARAAAIKSIIPAVIFGAAQHPPNNLQSTFDNANGFLYLTSTLYTRHLSVSAAAVYFVDHNVSIPAVTESLLPRLVIDPLPAHAFAIILILTGIIGTALQIISRRQRKKLMLAAPPGSIAAIVSLTSRSGFGDLLLPYDDEKTLEHKLAGLRFRLDKRTGAIVADDDGTGRYGMGADNSMLHTNHATVSAPSQNSSHLSYQAASGTSQCSQSWEQARHRTTRTSYIP